MSPRLILIVDVPLDKVAIGRLAVSSRLPREAVVAQIGEELAAALQQHCEGHQAVTPGVRVERSAGG
jgi:hypothetical protein